MSKATLSDLYIYILGLISFSTLMRNVLEEAVDLNLGVTILLGSIVFISLWEALINK